MGEGYCCCLGSIIRSKGMSGSSTGPHVEMGSHCFQERGARVVWVKNKADPGAAQVGAGEAALAGAQRSPLSSTEDPTQYSVLALRSLGKASERRGGGKTARKGNS